MNSKETKKIMAYRETVSLMLGHPKVREMDRYIQHGTTSCLSHCLYVSWISWQWAKNFNMRPDEVARGALLHDIFLYDWHVTKHDDGLHAFTHPGRALNNAEQHFELTPLEKDIIEHHMWPVTPAFPKFAATYIVIAADKYCAVMDTFGWNKHFTSIQNTLLGRD